MKYAEHIADLVGNTPLVKLNSVTEGIAATILAKVEYMNPGGSVKDRIALKMVEAAEASGELKPGGTIVEPTSGNTGVGLALVAQRKGYKCVFVCPDKVSQDKRDVLKAYGAEVVVCPTAVAPDHPDSYYETSDRLVREIDGAWKPNQYANPMGPASHYETTGPEVWDDTDGRVTHFVAGVGTGGTITGTGRYLREVSDDPRGRARAGHRRRPRGLGLLRWHRAPLPRRGRRRGLLADRLRPQGGRRGHRGQRRRLVRDDAPPRQGGGPARRRLLRHGGRGGPARRQGPAGRCRRRRAAARQRSRLHVEDLQRRLDELLRLHALRTTETTVGEVLHKKAGDMPALVHTHPTETVRDAIEILHEYSVSQMPVVKAEPPVMAGEVAGSVSERALLEALFNGTAHLTDSVDKHMEAGAAARRCRRARLGRPATSSRSPTPSWSSRTASRSGC